MEFGSPRFFLLLAATLGILHLARSQFARKLTIASASCLFYASWDWRYLGLLLGVGIFDYIAGHLLGAFGAAATGRLLLGFVVSVNVAVLGYFKYAHFFVCNLSSVLPLSNLESVTRSIILPAGISFYIFKALSYVVDVYRKEIRPSSSLLDYLTFLTFFPELIAGPIVRASVFLPQLVSARAPSVVQFLPGANLFVLGLVKKFLLADQMSIVADAVFDAPARFSSSTVWIGVVAYSLQIYCDFSGYSDMAIGTAKILGYSLPENFNMPYLASNVSEFWRRWHITLSEWLRDYVYIPLGGSREGVFRLYINLFATMLIGGLWHGASWTFVAWGGLHGGALVVQKGWRAMTQKRIRIPREISTLLTFAFVVLAWVPFRAKSWEITITIWRKLFWAGDTAGIVWYPSWFFICMSAVGFGHIIGSSLFSNESTGSFAGVMHIVFRKLGFAVHKDGLSGSFVVMQEINIAGLALLLILVLVTVLFMPVVQNPFIYFQF